MSKDSEGCASALFFIVAMVVAACIGGCANNHVWQVDVINRGLAEWQINPKTGDKAFEWLPVQPVEVRK